MGHDALQQLQPRSQGALLPVSWIQLPKTLSCFLNLYMHYVACRLSPKAVPINDPVQSDSISVDNTAVIHLLDSCENLLASTRAFEGMKKVAKRR